MSEEGNCLIIVPHDHPEIHDRLRAHFSKRANIQVRLDTRTGARAANELNVFAAGGGPLSPDLRADVEAEMRKAMASGTCEPHSGSLPDEVHEPRARGRIAQILDAIQRIKEP